MPAKNKEIKAGCCHLRNSAGNQKERRDTKGKGKDPLGANQRAYCKQEGHWRKDCPEPKTKGMETLAKKC